MSAVIVISTPNSQLVQTLLQNNIAKVICVNEQEVYFASKDGVTKENSFENKIKLDVSIPNIRAELVKAYPLFDRWISKSISFSSIVETCTIYTAALMNVIEREKVGFAILETGAPHHIFTYCLHVALKLTSRPNYYLYVNAIDQRLIVTEGIEKFDIIPITSYDATDEINQYIDDILNTCEYVPKDSQNTLAERKHNTPLYSIYLQCKHSLSGLRKHNTLKNKFRLNYKNISILENIALINKQKKYRSWLKSTSAKHEIELLGPEDIVYVGHMLPEATSFPDSIDYPGEIDVLLDLKLRFPRSRIFYREHPAINVFAEFGHIHYQGLHKNQEFYEDLQTLGILLVSNSTHMNELREKKCLFATKTGRVAIENSALGLHTIIYGYPFYGTKMPLTTHVTNVPFGVNASDFNKKSSNSNQITALRKYLIDRFSHSIANPGIGMVTCNSTDEYKNSLGTLVSTLSSASIKINS